MTTESTDGMKVAVLHPNLSNGGSGAVCLNVLETLAASHEVTLISDTEPDFEELNDFFGTAVDGVDVRTATVTGRLIDGAARLTSLVETVGFDRLRKAALTRLLDRTADEYDLVVSTKNELSHPAARIQYIHTPKWDRAAVPGLIGSDNPIQPVYDALCDRLANFDPETIARATLLTNSEWTAAIVEDVYGVEPRVVYPPVDTSGFEPRDWADREPGFVTIGRLAPNKNVEQTIDIVAELNERHPEAHLHLIGPVSHPKHREALESKIDQYDCVQYEGELSRRELLEFVSTHRFGLHTRPYESFGIVVAELVAGGTLPFIPATGAPPEIIDGREELLFKSTSEAVEQIGHYLSDPEAGRSLRNELPDVEQRFGRERFNRTIRELVRAEVAA